MRSAAVSRGLDQVLADAAAGVGQMHMEPDRQIWGDELAAGAGSDGS